MSYSAPIRILRSGSSSYYAKLIFIAWALSPFAALVTLKQLSVSLDEVLSNLVVVFLPVIYLLFFRNYRVYIKRIILESKILIFLSVLTISCILSFINTPNLFASTGYLVTLLWVIIAAYGFNRLLDDNAFRSSLVLIAIAGSLLLLVSLSPHSFSSSQRLSSVLGPNGLALTSYSFIMAGLLCRQLYISVPICLFNTFVILTTNSRTQVIAASIAVCLYLLFSINNRKNVIIFPMIILAITISFLAYSQQLRDIAVSILAWEDSYRGIASGFSGRMNAWQETWELFLQHPFTGVGYRMHEYYIQSQSSSHNGYLAILAEVGILGVIAFILPFFYAISKYLRQRTQQNYWIASFICGYLFTAMFERFLLNVGNVTSLLIIVFLVRSLMKRFRSTSNHKLFLTTNISTESIRIRW